jgi:hypothetical protein
MAHIQPTTNEERRKASKDLPAEARRLLAALAKLIKEPHADLGWYHAIGLAVGKLISTDQELAPSGWFVRLSEALGPSDSLFQKAYRLSTLYPTKKALKDLEKLKADWTLVWLAFPVEDKDDRHELLLKAVAGGWTQTEMRHAVQDRTGSNRRGAGGRPRKPLSALSAETALHEVGNQAERWLGFHEAWQKVKGWEKFVRDWPPGDLDRLLKLLQDAEGLLAKVEDARREASKTVARLKQKAEPRRQG